MILRAATDLDAGAVGALLGGFAERTAWMPRLYTGAEDIAHAGEMIRRGWVTVACKPSVVGFLARDGAEVNALYIAPEAQRQGIGAALLGAAKAASARLELWTHQANAEARAFYAAEGFAEVEMTDGAASDEKLPDVRLVWERAA